MRCAMGDMLMNIVTFGAHGRVKKVQEEYEELRQNLIEYAHKLEKYRDHVNEHLQSLIQAKKDGIFALKNIKKITKALKSKDRDANIAIPAIESKGVDFAAVENTLNIGLVAFNSAKGVGSGVATAAGAWALVSKVGVASTGIAIKALSGAAATNATLAWFGGGAVAVGGGGMTVGTAVLGGIVAIPALLIAAAFNHVSANKKIEELREQMLEMTKQMEELEKTRLLLKLAKKAQCGDREGCPKINRVLQS